MTDKAEKRITQIEEEVNKIRRIPEIISKWPSIKDTPPTSETTKRAIDFLRTQAAIYLKENGFEMMAPQATWTSDGGIGLEWGYDDGQPPCWFNMTVVIPPDPNKPIDYHGERMATVLVTSDEIDLSKKCLVLIMEDR